MNMHEWMTQSGAPQRPTRPQFDGQAYRALGQGDPRQDYREDFRSQMGGWRDSMHDYRGDMRDYRQDGRDQMGPVPGQPNTQFPLNPQGIGQGGAPAPQPVPGSGYGFNLADILQRFPNGLGRGIGQPGPNPGY